ncbi:MAG: rhomboid family intramembrane serine protease [Bacteroidales bacterium]|nr:rhomboid family intramembrane serine protease [Bacteroidales bacterium]
MFTVLIIVSIVLSSILAFNNRDFYIKGWFSPYDIFRFKQYYRFVTHIFIHASWEHLIFNMLTLYFFGMHVEDSYGYYFGKWGKMFYVIEFIFAGILASIPTYVKHRNNTSYVAVGASGAVASILFTSILFDPTNKIYIMFIPIGIPAYIFGPLYLIYSAYMAKKNVDRIAHDVHFWGSVIGFVLPLFIKPELLTIFVELIKAQ